MPPDAAPLLSTPPATSATSATAGAPGSDTGNGAWYPAEYKGMLESKGWDKFADEKEALPHILQAHQHAISFIGKDPKTLLTLPNPKDPASVEAFHKAIGRPDAVDKYTFHEKYKDNPLLKQLAPVAFEQGLSNEKWMAFQERLVGIEDAIIKEADEADAKAAETAHKKRMDHLRNELGAGYEPFVETARRAVRVAVPGEYKDPATGEVWNADRINAALERTLGADLTLRIFNTLGKFQAEDTTPGGRTPESGIQTPEAAAARRSMLIADAAWRQKYVDGDVAARAEMERLDMILASAKGY